MNPELKPSLQWLIDSGVCLVDGGGFPGDWEEPVSRVEFDRRISQCVVTRNVIPAQEKEAEATLMVRHYIRGHNDMIRSLRDAIGLHAFAQKKRVWTVQELLHMIDTIPKLNEEQMIAGLMETMK